MLFPSTLLLLLVGILAPAAAAPVGDVVSRATCANGFHIIVARGTLELRKEGKMGALAKSIAAKVPGSDHVALDYPALVPYKPSERSGVKKLRADITSYVKSCPKPKIVLLGYSQGANVIGDVLGGDESGDKAIEGAEADAIKGVILYSDPSFVPFEPYTFGTSKMEGKFPRFPSSIFKVERFSKIMRSYCDKGDTLCANGHNHLANLAYFAKYDKQATEFIVGLK